MFPTAIATKGPTGGAGSGSGRPAVANKPSYLTGGAGPAGHLSAKRGTEDLDYFIGDEAIAQAAGPGMHVLVVYRQNCMLIIQFDRIRHSLSHQTWSNRELGEHVEATSQLMSCTDKGARTIWSASGKTLFSNISVLSLRIITFSSLNL